MSASNIIEKTICIIGCGPSGLVAAKTLKEHGFSNITLYEKSTKIGGVWQYWGNDGAYRSASYKSLTTNTHKLGTCFSDVPFPKEYPSFPSQPQMISYFQAYAERFQLEKHIHFECDVCTVDYDKKKTCTPWKVTYRKQSTLHTNHFHALVVANGHHSEPIQPDKRARCSTFQGKMMHSFDYNTPDFAKDKIVVMVGYGSSGRDIARDIFPLAKQVVVSSRSPDKWSFVAAACERHNTKKKPPILIKPGVVEAKEHSVYFKDGTHVDDVDLIIWSIGYNIRFSFFDQSKKLSSKFKVKHNVHNQPNSQYVPNLYQHCLPLAFTKPPSIIFLALLNVAGSLHPVAEAQSLWFARLLTGKFQLPKQKEMERWVKKHHPEDSNKSYRVIDVIPTRYIHSLRVQSGLLKED